MAKDFRHNHGRHRKPQFQRKSQQKMVAEVSNNASVSKVWTLGFFVAVVGLLAVYASQYFNLSGSDNSSATASVISSDATAAGAVEGNNADINSADSTSEAKPSVLSAAKEIKDKAFQTVEEVKTKLAPEKVVVEALHVKEEEQLVDATAEPEFSFYEGLAKTEVVVDAVPLSIQLERAYFIQAGTFGSEAVAYKEKARLARMGQELEVSVYQGTKRIYYRLRVGPYTDRLELNKKRNELRRLGVDTLLVKAPR